MDFLRILRITRNIFGHVLLHTSSLIILLWSTGALLALLTGYGSTIGFNFDSLIVTGKLTSWVIENWSKLSFEDYDHIKLKTICSLLTPISVLTILYIKNFDRIKTLEFFQPKESVYGSADWASQRDIERANLRAKHGVLLGKDAGGYFVADGFQHVLLFAPTGSGKGVGFVIPNLLFWDHSVVVHDIKLENYELTSGWRYKQGSEVYVWEPANPDGVTHCYNPIDWISKKPGQMVDDVQKISNLVLPKQEFWTNEARSLFVGVLLYLLADDNKPASFGEVVRTMRSDDVVYNLAVALDTLGGIMHPVGYMNVAAFLQKADKERSGVISTLNSSIELWANPLIDAATATSDFSVMEFKKKKTTVFVGLTPDNIQRLQKLMQVFYQQATEFLSRKMPNVKEEPYGVLFLMDEFPTLGKMEQFKAGIAYFRGYRVRLFLIIQDTQQLKGTYEDAGMNSFLSNSTFRITFAANNYETANLISQLCGNKTVENTSESRPSYSLNMSQRSTSVSKVQRALLLPQEVIQLPRDEQIVLIESFPPIKSKKIMYFQDNFFTKRLLPPTEVPTQEPYNPNQDDDNEDSDINEENLPNNATSENDVDNNIENQEDDINDDDDKYSEEDQNIDDSENDDLTEETNTEEDNIDEEDNDYINTNNKEENEDDDDREDNDYIITEFDDDDHNDQDNITDDSIQKNDDIKEEDNINETNNLSEEETNTEENSDYIDIGDDDDQKNIDKLEDDDLLEENSSSETKVNNSKKTDKENNIDEDNDYINTDDGSIEENDNKDDDSIIDDDIEDDDIVDNETKDDNKTKS